MLKGASRRNARMKNKDDIAVLIVDDEDRFRDTTSVALRKRGFRASAVASGIEAIKEVQNAHFDVVILDVKMPGISGYEALDAINTFKPDLPVIMLTGHGFQLSEQSSAQRNVFYLGKPADIDLLVEMIHLAMNRAASETNKPGADRDKRKDE
jgi:DNA-binding NtrC family response regulator